MSFDDASGGANAHFFCANDLERALEGPERLVQAFRIAAMPIVLVGTEGCFPLQPESGARATRMCRSDGFASPDA